MPEVLVRREQHYSSDVIDLCSEDILNCEDTAYRFNTDPGSACAGDMVLVSPLQTAQVQLVLL